MEDDGVGECGHLSAHPIVKHCRAHAHIVGQPLGSGLAPEGEALFGPDLLGPGVVEEEALPADEGLAVEGDIQGFVDAVHSDYSQLLSKP